MTIIISNFEQEFKSVLKKLESFCKLKRLGFPIRFLGTQTEKCNYDSIFLHQTQFTDNLLSEFTHEKLLIF